MENDTETEEHLKVDTKLLKADGILPKHVIKGIKRDKDDTKLPQNK